MTACINKTMLLGFLGDDPVRRETQRGDAVVSLSLGTTERWKDRNGERRSATEWHRVVIYNEALGKTAMSYLRKGSAVYVEGAIRSRKYTDQKGVERKISEIVLAKFGGELKLIDRRQDDVAGSSGGEPSGSPDLDDHVPY